MVINDISVTNEKEVLAFEANLSALGRELADWYRVLPNEVVDSINAIIREKILDDTSMSRDVEGSDFQPLQGLYVSLKDEVVGVVEPNLRFGYGKSWMDKETGKIYGGEDPTPRAFDNFYIERVGAKNRSQAVFDGNRFGYMLDHQEGYEVTYGGEPVAIPERRWFPDKDSDFTGNSNYAKVIDEIRKLIQLYLDAKSQGKRFVRPSWVPANPKRSGNGGHSLGDDYGDGGGAGPGFLPDDDYFLPDDDDIPF